MSQEKTENQIKIEEPIAKDAIETLKKFCDGLYDAFIREIAEQSDWIKLERQEGEIAGWRILIGNHPFVFVPLPFAATDPEEDKGQLCTKLLVYLSEKLDELPKYCYNVYSGMWIGKGFEEPKSGNIEQSHKLQSLASDFIQAARYSVVTSEWDEKWSEMKYEEIRDYKPRLGSLTV